MRSNDQEVFEQALRWHAQGLRSVIVTVLSTYGASPRPPGAMAVINEAGLIVGSVSGGCVEDDLVQEVLAGHFWDAAPAVQHRTYGRDAAERERYRLPCGNALRLVVESRWDACTLTEALRRMERGESLYKQLDYGSGLVRLESVTPADGRSHPASAPIEFAETPTGVRVLLGPRHRLLLIGATEVSRYLAPIAQSLGYAVTVCDPREEYTGSWTDRSVSLIHQMPDDAVVAFACDERTAVVTVTHDPKLDDLALMEALKSPAFYVGALGSSITTSKRKARLLQFDVTPEQVSRLKGPVGLPIGSRTPAEIAVSIAAELIQVRSLIGSPDWRSEKPNWAPQSAPCLLG
ncbi:MAG TPA: XdhC family protein [Aquabacterium sp.]|nr:XdhC family protein [Aquabacterium sp.]